MSGGVQAEQGETMLGLVGDGAAEGKDYAFGGGGIPVFDSIPLRAVRALGDVIETGIADQGAQILFVEGDGVFCDCVLLGGPLSGVEHDGEPTHHAAAKHVEEVLDMRCGPFLYVAL